MQEIKKIYAHLNFDMSVTTENNMQNYLYLNKGKSKSKHVYNIKEFNINREKLSFILMTTCLSMIFNDKIFTLNEA